MNEGVSDELNLFSRCIIDDRRYVGSGLLALYNAHNADPEVVTVLEELVTATPGLPRAERRAQAECAIRQVLAARDFEIS